MHLFTAVVLSALVTAAAAYNLFAILCLLDFFSGKKKSVADGRLPPVSILKPLKGMEPGLEENLISFCVQDYPEYEVLFGFLDHEDEAVPLAKKVASRFPGRARVVAGGHDIGANKKISNLYGLAEEAGYGLLAISDSDMRVESRYLKTIVNEYEGGGARTGLVTSLYSISGPASIGSALESLTIALDFIPSVLVARRLEGVTFGLGASMLVSKETLADIGGLRPVADYLADDYQIGNRLWKKGYGIILSEYVMETISGKMSVREHLTHQLRWAATYRASRPKGFLGYGVTFIFPFALLLMFEDFTAVFVTAAAAALLLRFAAAAIVFRGVIRNKGWLKWLFLLPVKDLLGLCVWAAALARRTVLWRGVSYRILKGGKLAQVE